MNSQKSEKSNDSHEKPKVSSAPGLTKVLGKSKTQTIGFGTYSGLKALKQKAFFKEGAVLPPSVKKTRRT